MKEYIKYIPLTLFCIFLGKILFKGASYEDAGVLFILASFAAFYEFKEQGKKILEFEDKLNTYIKGLENQVKELDDIKSFTKSLKLGQTLKSAPTISNRTF